MNQKAAHIVLRDYLATSDAWGHALGHRVQEALRGFVEEKGGQILFAISLRGITHTDVSFPRTAVVELAKHFRARRGFYLIEVEDEDVLENWDSAAERCDQPLFVWADDRRHHLLGPQPGEGKRAMLDHVLSVGAATAGEAARALDIKVPNASNKLKELWEEGYLLRRERIAPTGGVEYEYVRIG